jgi:hypothetical protein
VLTIEHPLVERLGADCLAIAARSFQTRIHPIARILRNGTFGQHSALSSQLSLSCFLPR